ncbi:molybdenum cofactor guanylyltransferase [Asanoa sp. NPDC050611]|uniref:molybdenum cofactor guanylyltransferase n=1 Tax=Asanoa sp. NPDC050611 TaxID=3157098 RepID=UPI0033DB63EB
MAGFAAVVLAGGSARRMGGSDKPSLVVAGRSLRDRVLDALADADPRIVVGGRPEVPARVVYTREDPPGGGPVAAIAAGLSLVGPSPQAGRLPQVVALVAGDLPLLTAAAMATLRNALSTADGALFVDPDGRRQLLCGVWRVDSLRRRLTEMASGVQGASMRALVEPLRVVEVPWSGDGPPPWFDCDTEEDLRIVREWLTAKRAG